MNKELLLTLSLIALALPFVISLFIAIQPRSRPKTIDDYFLYSRSLKPEDFLKTSVGYSLQAAAIILFLMWSLNYGAVVLFIPVAWSLGYVLIMLAVKAGKLDHFLKSSTSSTTTIHGYVGAEASGRSQRPLVLILALTTVVGIGGTLVAEIDYALSLVLPTLGFAKGPSAMFISTGALILILFFTACYVLWGGYKAVVETDKLQVPLSYVSFCVVLFAVTGIAAFRGRRAEAIIIASTAVFLCWRFYRSRGRIASTEKDYPRWRDRLQFYTLIVVGLFTVVFCLNGKQTTPISLAFFVHHDHFLGFGLVGASSLVLANTIWQFVDISSLQRLQSLELPRNNDENPAPAAKPKLLAGLRATAVEAGGGWVVVILLAFALQAAGVGNTYRDTSSFLREVSGAATLITPLLVFALMCFALSTVDGFISAVAYVAYYDIHQPNDSDAAEARRLTTARITTFLAVGIIFVAYVMLKWYLANREDPSSPGLLLGQVLYAIYAVQISIGPIVLLRLFWPSMVNGIAGITSVVAGWVGAFATALSGPRLGVIQDSWYVIPPLAAFIMALLAYFVTFGLVSLLRSAVPKKG